MAAEPGDLSPQGPHPVTGETVGFRRMSGLEGNLPARRMTRETGRARQYAVMKYVRRNDRSALPCRRGRPQEQEPRSNREDRDRQGHPFYLSVTPHWPEFYHILLSRYRETFLGTACPPGPYPSVLNLTPRRDAAKRALLCEEGVAGYLSGIHSPVPPCPQQFHERVRSDRIVKLGIA